MLTLFLEALAEVATVGFVTIAGPLVIVAIYEIVVEKWGER